MENLTLGNLQTTVIVLLGIAAVMVALDKGIEAWKHLRGTAKQQERERQTEARFVLIEERLNLAESRLREGDAKFDRSAADMGMVLDVLQALLLHMYTGNDKQNLRSTVDKLSGYMSSR